MYNFNICSRFYQFNILYVFKYMPKKRFDTAQTAFIKAAIAATSCRRANDFCPGQKKRRRGTPFFALFEFKGVYLRVFQHKFDYYALSAYL